MAAVHACIATGVAMCMASTAAAQTSDSAGFIVREGADTVVIERVPASVVEKLLAANESHAAPPGAPHVADHIFVKDPVGDLSRYASFPSMRVPPDVLGVITDWTVQRLGESVPKNNFRSNQHE